MLMMSPYILVQPDYDFPKMRKIGDVEIELQTKYNWNKREANICSGWVTALPNSDEIFGYPVNISIGDYVFFHFHQVDDESRIIEGNHRVDFRTVYCKQDLNGEITMCNDFLLLEPECHIVEAEPETLTMFSSLNMAVPSVRKMIESHGIVAYKPDGLNLEIGDRVHLKENSHYELRVKGGKTYLRVRKRDIVLVDKMKVEV